MKPKKVLNYVCLLSFLLASVIHAQEVTVTGIITGDSGRPVPGVNVLVKGTTVGAISNFDGDYSIKASQGDILVFSSIGFETQEISVGSNTTINVQMVENISQLNEVVISSTRKPVRILQATTAVNRIDSQDIELIKPESVTESLQNTPGVVINENQGRKGGFRIRGFPGGNIYTTTLLDGLPTSASSSLSSSTQELYSYDSSVERIEVVRGAAATLFGRASAAGAVNIISRTGGTEHKGSFSITKYNNVANEGHQFDEELDYRVDMNFHGPISEKLRYNIGGFLINDSGQKEQANKDKGGQIRANLDWLISEESKIRFSVGYTNYSFNNITDSPYDLNKNAPGGDFLGSTVFTNDYRQLFGDLALNFVPSVAGYIGGERPVIVRDSNGNSIVRNPADFTELNKGGYASIDATFGLGSGWSLNHKSRIQAFDWNDVNDITFSNFYDLDDNIFRFFGRSEQDVNDFITETRVSKFIESDNATYNITGGFFYSDGKRDRLGTNLFYNSTVSSRPVFSPFLPQFEQNLLRTSATTSHREEKSTGVFVGGEMVFFEKLSVNLAFRYDWFNGFLNNDPEEIRSTGVDAPVNGTELIEIDEKFEDYSFSIGANYLLGETSAIYANYLRAFSLPSVATTTFVRPDGNEIVNNLELGFRAGFGDLTVDATVFNTRIDDRVALFLNNTTQEFEPTAAGTNKILGGEIALTYAPKFVKGLLLRGNVTLQNSEYDNFQVRLSTNRAGTETNVDQNGDLFGLNLVGSGTSAAIDIAGNKVENTPSVIYNINLGYSRDRWGIDFGGFTYTGRFADATNLYETPDLSVYNAGAYVTFPLDEKDELRFSMRIKNIFDGQRPQLLFASTRDDSALREKQANPTIPEGRQTFAILQNPKRVLFTIEYSF